MKILKFLTLILFANTLIIYAQSEFNFPKERRINWNNVGIEQALDSNKIYEIIDINEFYKPEDNGFFNTALNRILEKYKGSKIIYFPKGIYKFDKSIKIPSNCILRGDNSDRTRLVFNLSGKKATCIALIGKTSKALELNQEVIIGQSTLTLDNSQIKNNAKFVQIYQGTNEWGKSSSGKPKAYRKAQILYIESIENQQLFLHEKVRLSYKQKDAWGNDLKLRIIEPIQYSGIENLSINREDKPPKNGGSIISLSLAANCWVKGVESKIGANYHIAISNSYRIEVTGCYIHDAYNNGGGGNGYGVMIGSSSNCLVENNIFEGLRHAMIIAGGADGNVFGYNASFYKPFLNLDEASISIHGHYPYLNLFESNVVEYINADYVWGMNGPYNTFIRNWSYHEGIFGLFRNQELRVENGTNSSNIIGNLANVEAGGKDNLIYKNFPFAKLPENEMLSVRSLYHPTKPEFIDSSFSWPCIGLKSSENEKVSQSIPALKRFSGEKKTVDYIRLK